MKRFVMLTEIEQMAKRLTHANFNRLTLLHDPIGYKEATKEADEVWKRMKELRAATEQQFADRRKGKPTGDMFL